MSAFKITNARRLDKGALVGAFDLELPSGLKILGVMLFERDGKRGVGFPSKPFVKTDGTKTYAKLLEFANREAADRFKAAVLPLAEGALL
jgi:hypothetical protein